MEENKDKRRNRDTKRGREREGRRRYCWRYSEVKFEEVWEEKKEEVR